MRVSAILRRVQEGAGPRPFDATTRRLIEADPEGWLVWLGLPPDGPVQPIESDVSTVLAEVDKVLQVDGPTPWIAHIEVQSSHDPILPIRLVEYHALLLRRHLKHVRSTVVLLREEADGPELTGYFEEVGSDGDVSLTLRYRVVRLWERPLDELLNGSLGILPLAPLAAETAQLPDVIARLDERFEQEASPLAAHELWSATLLLLGLLYDADEARYILRGVTGMRESSTYQAILEEGREKGREEGRVDQSRRLLIRLGSRRFGAPDAATVARIERVGDLDTLERLGDALFTATSWEQLLQDGAR
jgi:predicted transposase YdaD